MARVLTGLDRLLASGSSRLRGQRLGLLCHQASVSRELDHAVELIRSIRGVSVRALFAPEHGLWGAAQDHATIATRRDRKTGLPVWSLYGRRRAPTPAMLSGLDAVVCDLQDVGARYYTFVWTMALTMETGRSHNEPWPAVSNTLWLTRTASRSPSRYPATPPIAAIISTSARKSMAI